MSDVALALVGATASGKSALAHRVVLGAQGEIEIISVDAMGVYRGMDLATAKPTKEERREVRYHLIDLVDPSEEFTVAQFQRAAREAADEIAGRGHHVLYVGGTGLYGRAVIDDLDLPGRYPAVRAELESRAKDDLPGLYAELLRLDPLAAGRIEPTNERRIIRALEVTLGAGRPFSSFGEGLEHYGESSVLQVGLEVDLAELDRRVEERFNAWMAEGLLEEVRRLSSGPRPLSRTARQAVGYKELLAHVEEGKDLDACVRDAMTQSRRLVRRQRAWFRRDPRIEWFDEPTSAEARIAGVLRSPSRIVGD